MKYFLRLFSVLFFICGIGFFGGVTPAYAWDVGCDRADEIFAQCRFSTRIERIDSCDSCCGQALSAGYLDDSIERTACYEMCMQNSTEGCSSGGGSGGGDSGGGSGSGGASCTTNEDCWGLHPICDATTHTCRDAQDNEIVQAMVPYCGDGSCVCHFIEQGNEVNSAEYIFTAMQHCGIIENYMNNELGFPQTDCKTLASGMGYFVVEYSTNSSYPICQGFIQQSSERSRSCTECNPGFKLVSFEKIMQMTYREDYETDDFLNWPCSGGDSIDVEMNVCVECVPKYGSWVDYGTGYQRRLVSYNPDCDTSTDYQYQCAAGYYGSSTNGTSGCTRCPLICNSTDLRGTSPAGATSVTQCCAPVGATGNDTYGAFRLKTAACATEN